MFASEKVVYRVILLCPEITDRNSEFMVCRPVIPPDVPVMRRAPNQKHALRFEGASSPLLDIALRLVRVMSGNPFPVAQGVRMRLTSAFSTKHACREFQG